MSRPYPRAPAPGRAALAGVVGGGLGLGVAELLAGTLGATRSLVASVGTAVVRALPGPVVEAAIALLGGANRLVLFTLMGVTLAVAGAWLGRTAASRRWVGPAGVLAIGGVGAAVAAADPLVPAPAAVVGALGGGVVGAAALAWLVHVTDRVADPDDARVPAPARRAFVGWTSAAAATALLAGVVGRRVQEWAATAAAVDDVRLPTPSDPLPPPPARASLDVDGISPLLTPNDAFYRIDTALTLPRVDPDEHVVRVTGLVERPLTLSYGQLLELADTEADVTLACVSNEVGGDLVGTARWQGVPLARILERAGVHPDATQVVGRAVDGWTAGFPVAAATDGRPALIAVGMNGEPLPRRHGFPVRLVVAGLYGYVSDTKWLTEIELTTFAAYDAYWIRRGWAERGPVKTQSRIDVPRADARLSPGTTVVAGVAWAGERGVRAVEVSVDDGPWRPADLAGELAATTWRQWRLDWEATPGRHRLSVRATDGTGARQTAARTAPLPDGATGLHTVEVEVEEGAGAAQRRAGTRRRS